MASDQLEAVLRLEAVRKSYGVGTPVEAEVLHGIELIVRKGSFDALTGPSGSGKSTLLNLIGLLERPTSGNVIVQGENTSSLDDARLTAMRGRSIGFVFQFHLLIPAFSALENVMMPMLLDRGRRDAEMAERAKGLLADVGLGQALGKKPSELSGGMQQRVAIARALVMRPSLVLADEPTGNLDTKTANEIFDLLRKFNERYGTAFLVVTHDARLAARCDRNIELVDGRIVRDTADVQSA